MQHSAVHMFSLVTVFYLTTVWLFPSQASADKVEEVTAFSKECLEKIERSRIEKNYDEVCNTAASLTSFPWLILSSGVSASPSSVQQLFPACSVLPLSGREIVSGVSGETGERLG